MSGCCCLGQAAKWEAHHIVEAVQDLRAQDAVSCQSPGEAFAYSAEGR